MIEEYEITKVSRYKRVVEDVFEINFSFTSPSLKWVGAG